MLRIERMVKAREGSVTDGKPDLNLTTGKGAAKWAKGKII